MKSVLSAKRIGIMGGSFDPVHIAHMIIAQESSEKFNLSEVIFIPAAIPPHKQHLQKADAHHRLKMLQLTVMQYPMFSVSEMELIRGGISYTFDTIKELKTNNPDAELMMIIGSDTLIDLHNWYKIDELLGLCEVATFMRPGLTNISNIEKKIKFSGLHKEKLQANVFQTRLIEMSSTQVRECVEKGVGIHSLVPPEVETYILEHGLYRG